MLGTPQRPDSYIPCSSPSRPDRSGGAVSAIAGSGAHRWARLLIAFGVFVLGAVPAAVEAADDYTAGTSTTGTVAVGGSQTGEIESHGDVDWIRVTLVGGTRYVIDYEGSANGQGTLSDPYFRGVYDSNGNLISGTTDDSGGLGFNSRIDFTPGSSGTYFLGLGNSAPSLTGTYRVSVTEFNDYVVEVLIPGDDYEDDMTTTGSVSVGGSAVGNFQKARGPSDSDWIRVTTDTSFWAYFDHDWFRVTFDAGKTYRLHIKGSWTDHGTLRDTRIAGIYDSNGNLIQGTVDDNSGIDKEARTIFTAPTTGTHYISATRGEFPFPAQHSGTYTVKVQEIGVDDYAANTSTTGSVTVDGSTTGTIERLGDLDWFAVTLEGYATYRFDLEGIGEDWPLLEGKFIQGIYDSNGNVFAGTYTPESRDDEVRAVFAPEQGGTYYVAVGAGQTFFGTGEYRLSATKFIPEVSDWFDTKGRVGVGSYVAGAIEEASDRDWFRVTLEAGTTYQVDLEGSPTNQGTLRDPYLHGIRDSEGDLIWYTTDDNSGVGMNSRVNFTPDSDGTYYIEAGALFGRTGTYRLSVWQETSDDEPLTASYPASAYMSARHKGTDDRPQVVVSFSRPVAAIGADTPSVTVTGGTVVSVQAHAEDGVENGRIFFLSPDGNGDIAFALLPGVACDAGGICAADGGLLLSNNLSTTIPGPSVGEPALSVSDASANEADESIGFAVTLSAAASATVTVDYATADGTATAGADYTATSGTLTFQTGDTQKTISVLIIDDLVEDDGETLTLTLSNASGATLADAEATGTIHNTEVTEPDPLTASFSGAPAEHDGESAFTFQVQFSEEVGISYVTLRDESFSEANGDVTAARRVDGRHDLWEITVEPDDSREAVTITLNGDRDCGTTGAVCTRGDDPRPLSNSPSATVAGPPVAVETTPTVSISGGSGKEGDDSSVSFTVTLDEAATGTVTVDYATSDGTADAGDDYTAKSGTLSFSAGQTSKTISIAISDDIENESDETFTVTLSNASGADIGTSAATGTIRNRRVTPLTASFEGVPAEHDGESVFTFTLRFSEDPAVSYTVLRDEAFSVTGGAVQAARRVDGRNDLREIHVEPDPDGLSGIRIALPATTDCAAADAICTADGRPLSQSLSATVAGPVGISVGDARVEEAEGAVLSFAVTLSRAASGALTVDYETSDGSAQAGVDYTGASGTLTFQAGESSRTIAVTVLDDSHDDDGETLTLTLSNPSSGRLTDAEATGTIENRDPLPRALLARFGRTAAVHVVEHVEERLAAPREPGFRGRVAGRELRRGMERELALSFLSQLGGSAGANGYGVGGHDPMAGSPGAGVRGMGSLGMPGLARDGVGMPGAAGTVGADARMRGAGTGALGGNGMMGGAPGPMSAAAGPDGGLFGGGLHSMGLGGDNLLTGSAFAMNRESHGGILSFWSRGARSHFAGREGTLGLSGDVRTTMFGADYAKGPVVAGLSLSHSRGLGEYAGVAAGQVASAVTGLYPWLGYKATDRVTVWGVAGYGRGGLLLTPDSGTALESGLSMAMAAAGTRGELIAGGAAGFALAFKADALWVGTAIDGVDGPAGRLKATNAAVTRLRTGLEGSRDYALAGQVVAPTERRGRPAARRRGRRDGRRHGRGRRPDRIGRGDRAGGGRARADAAGASGRRVPRAGHGAVSELQPDAVDAAGLDGAGGAVLGRSGDERGRGAVGPGDHGGDGAGRPRVG